MPYPGVIFLPFFWLVMAPAQPLLNDRVYTSHIGSQTNIYHTPYFGGVWIGMFIFLSYLGSFIAWYIICSIIAFYIDKQNSKK